jgi:nitrogen regulatory protein PII
MTQKQAWTELGKLENKLRDIQSVIKDFEVEEAIDVISESLANYNADDGRVYE